MLFSWLLLSWAPFTTPQSVDFVPMAITLIRGEHFATVFYNDFQSMSADDLESYFSKNSERFDPETIEKMKLLAN